MVFPANSRYQNVATAKLTRPDSSEVVYLTRRFVPQPERFTLLQEHTVVEGDRLDNITARSLGDAERVDGGNWPSTENHPARRHTGSVNCLMRHISRS
jgi:hypothetical protein